MASVSYTKCLDMSAALPDSALPMTVSSPYPSHRDTLVREVHHRIKNHLQGLIGLIAEQARQRPECGDCLNYVATQLRSVAIVHGLQSRQPNGDIRLCDMLDEMVLAMQRSQSPSSRIELELQLERGSVRVAEDEAVPIALIANELLRNAAKHGGAEGDIRVTLATAADGVTIEVTNPGQLPPGFDFSGERGLGTGLTLIRALLPRRGASLAYSQSGGRAGCRLTLAPPVISRVFTDAMLS